MARRSSLSAGLIAGCTAAAAVTWLLGTPSGRGRLGRLLGRGGDEVVEVPAFIELPDSAAATTAALQPDGVIEAAAQVEV